MEQDGKTGYTHSEVKKEEGKNVGKMSERDEKAGERERQIPFLLHRI